MAHKDEITHEDKGSEKSKTKSRFRMRRKNALPDKVFAESKRNRRPRSRREKKLSRKDLEEKKGEISQSKLWLSQNWKMMLALFLIFMFGLFLRSYYYYPPATENGFILSGNDPYYHKRVVDYVQENHEHLIFDPLLSYPDGALNPRPPMFDWSVAILGMLLSPLFGGNVVTSTWQVMEFSPAFWGALTVVPVYLIGKEMFNKKAGLICAFLLATMPSHVERSPLGFSDHDAIVLFFVVLGFFFFIRALNSLTIRDKWVKNWLHPKDIPNGVKEWFKFNQIPVAFSLLSGLSLASVALIWKGFLYPVVIIIVYFFIQLILNKFRNKDSLGVSVVTIITLAVIAFLPIPYYYGNHMNYVIEPAMEILIAVIIVSAILVPTRDSPWLLVFSTLGVVIICGLILLMYVFPEIGSTYFSGQGYFAKNKIFSTIAEAQAPDYSRAVFSYGVVTTFLALYAIIISIIRVAKDLKAHYLFMTIWGITAVYMAISATRFIFNAGPIFAILSGWMIYELIVKLDFRKMRKHYRSLKGGGRFYAMKKSVKVSHIIGILFLVFLILLPNVWLGWDAGIPHGEKKAVDVAVYDILPWFMKPKEYNADQASNTSLYPKGVGTMYNRTNLNELKYFGAFGHGFPSDYWLDSMRWLSEQDQDLPIEDRPAFISWWDYGFWCIYLGQHPTAADNFQGRVQFAGSFISSKNETQAISLLIARILEADQAKYQVEKGTFRLHDETRTILVKYLGNEKAAEVEDVVVNPWRYRKEVLNNPDRYGHWSSDIVDVTLIYAVLQTWIPELLDDDERVWLLHELQDVTGYCLRYFAIDSRLFPFGPGNTGIFYAPLKLSDHRIDDNNEPYDYLRTFIVGSDGRERTVEDFIEAQKNDPDLEVSEYKLKYYEPFLDSMLMKCYIGYTLGDIGAADPGEKGTEPNIPSVHATNYPSLPAWMMKHFQLVYKTAYYNPYNATEYKNHPDAWKAKSETEAKDLIEKLENDGVDNDKNGIVDDRGEGGVITGGLRSGVVYIKYYEGAYLNGTVKTNKGTPVPNIRVTVSDEYQIPHDSVLTDENGTFHLIAPPGNVTIDVSTGGFGEGEYMPYNLLTQVEGTLLNSTNINITDDQAMRRKIDKDGDGTWDYYITQDFQIEENWLEGKIFMDIDSNGEYNAGSDLNITQAEIIVLNEDLDMEFSTITDENGTYLFDDLTPGTYNISVEVNGHIILLEEETELETHQKEKKDIGIKPGYLEGKVVSMDGDNLIDKEIKLLDKSNESSMMINTDSDGYYNFSLLLPGNYTLYVDIDGFESYQEDFYLGEGDINLINVTLSPSTDVEGNTFIAESGIKIGNVTIRFDGKEENQGLTKFVRSNETGFYLIDLKNGAYRISVKHDFGEITPYVYVGEIDAEGGVVFHDIALQRSIEVYGFIWADTNQNGTIEPYEKSFYALLSFENSNGKISLVTNSTSYYRTYLPYGNYSVYATFQSSKRTYIGKLSLLQFESLEYIIKLENGDTLGGYVYYDVNKNDEREEPEGLSYATLTFFDENGTDIKINTDPIGHYSINLEKEVNYTVLVEAHGFEPFNLGPLNISEMLNHSDFKLIARVVTTSGMTRYEGSAIGNVNLSFYAKEGTGSENASILSNLTGDYSIDLKPGEYRVFVDHNTTENNKPVRYLYNKTISLNPGEVNKVIDIDLIKFIKINGTINGTSENVTIYFGALGNLSLGAKHVFSENGTFEIFLIPDDYSVRVKHEVEEDKYYVFLSNFNFNESKTIELNLSIGIIVKGQLKYDNLPLDGDTAQMIDIIFIGNGSIIENADILGYFKTFLSPNQTYEVSVNRSLMEDSNDIWYKFNGTIHINNTDILDWDINLTKFIKVTGTVYIDWDDDNKVDPLEGLENVTIKFENGTDVITLVTNELGFYETFLDLQKEYNVTLIPDFPIQEDLFNIKATTTDPKKDFPVTPANLTVSGRTMRNSSAERYTAIWFYKSSPTAINGSTISDANGNFSIELPYGEYSLYARKIIGSEVFVYLGEISVMPQENLIFEVNLIEGIKINGKSYYINSTGQNLSAQTQINFQDVGKVTTNTNEKGQFELWLPSGKFKVTADLSTFEYNMSMNYSYNQFVEFNNNTALYMNLSKIEIYSVELKWIEGIAVEVAQNESHTYNVSIKNIGTIGDTFDLSADVDPGWNIDLPNNFTLGINQSSIFEVHIQTSPNAIVEHGPVKIFANSRVVPTSWDDLDLEINVTQVYEAANLSFGTTPKIAFNNTMIYPLNITNNGNGKDDFTLNLSDVPEYWEAHLNQVMVSLAANEEKSINLTLKIPYNYTKENITLILTAISSINLTSTMGITVELPNLEIQEEDLTVTGDQVSEGALNKEPIPGFESIALIVVLIVVAFIMRRRNSR